MKTPAKLWQPESVRPEGGAESSARKTQPLRLPDTGGRASVQVKKILVPIDFSDASLEAFRYAVAFAERFGASLCLVHVVEPDFVANDPGAVPPAVSGREVANRLHHKLVMLARREAGPLIAAIPLVCAGKAFHEIVRAARTFKADLIIIATRGYGGLKRVILGSTAERVVRHAPCPVLVVRERERGFVRRDPPFLGKESP